MTKWGLAKPILSSWSQHWTIDIEVVEEELGDKCDVSVCNHIRGYVIRQFSQLLVILAVTAWLARREEEWSCTYGVFS
jgi:hypothetical protein